MLWARGQSPENGCHDPSLVKMPSCVFNCTWVLKKWFCLFRNPDKTAMIITKTLLSILVTTQLCSAVHCSRRGLRQRNDFKMILSGERASEHGERSTCVRVRTGPWSGHRDLCRPEHDHSTPLMSASQLGNTACCDLQFSPERCYFLTLINLINHQGN